MNGMEILNALDSFVHHEYSSSKEKSAISYFRKNEREIWRYLVKMEGLHEKTKDDIIKILENMKENIPQEFAEYHPDTLIVTINGFQNMIRRLA